MWDFKCVKAKKLSMTQNKIIFLTCAWGVAAAQARGHVLLWMADFLSSRECGGTTIHCLIVNVSGWDYSPGHKTLIAFLPSCTRLSMSCDIYSLSPLLVEPHHPCPEAPIHVTQLTQEEHRRSYTHIYVYISRHQSTDHGLFTLSKSDIGAGKLPLIVYFTSHTRDPGAGQKIY